MVQRFDSDSAPHPDAAPTPARPEPPPLPNHDPAPEPKPATHWWLLPTLLLLGFALLVWQVKTNGPVTSLDIRVRDRVQHWATSPSMSWTFHPGRAIADLGNEPFSFAILILATALATLTARSWRPVLITAGAFATLGTVVLLKLWIGRPGPGTAVLGNANLGFFPSGHTADATLCYGTSALLLCVFAIPRRLSPPHARRLRQAIIAAAIVLVLATIFGLLWSNFHWLSDTIGSLCWCGAALAVLTRLTTSPLPARVRRRHPTAYPQ